MPRIRVHDIELYYEDVGQGPALLLIHGLGSSTRDWEKQIVDLSRHFRVIMFDVRGHGRSDKPPGPYSVPLFATDTAELLKSLGIGSAHVVGISMGGMIAFQLAVSAPDLVQSLVIVNSGPELIVRTVRERIQVLQRQLIVQLLGMRRMGEVLGRRLFPKPEQTDLRTMFAERWAENDPRAYRDALQALIGWSVADQLSDINCPTLVIAADTDYTPVSLKEAFVAKMPHAKLAVIRDARHAVPVERPEQFNEVLSEFLLQHT
ncbi:MAG TPA: alpha/beta hydrolase [Anaerolineales bacterium]|nr:alpha/beta hydrolase [Anaerolineales bacterium]